MKISNLKDKLITGAVILLVVLVMYILKIPCLFKLLFNISCPGCGITRAYISLFRFEFKKAFEFNPMFWSVPIFYLFYLFDEKLFKRKWLNALIITLLCIGFFVSWIFNLVVSK